VENWWCPFDHSCKREYAEGAIDRSFWHIYSHELGLLHPEDRDNPIWNEEAIDRGEFHADESLRK
jgi:hypothetical protein